MVETDKVGGDNDHQLKHFYEAARPFGIGRADERTFEEWRDSVSDYGLDAARQAYFTYRDTEHVRPQTAVVGRTKAWRAGAFIKDVTMASANQHYRDYQAMCEAVDALIAFEAEHKIGESK